MMRTCPLRSRQTLLCCNATALEFAVWVGVDAFRRPSCSARVERELRSLSALSLLSTQTKQLEAFQNEEKKTNRATSRIKIEDDYVEQREIIAKYLRKTGDKRGHGWISESSESESEYEG
jgi:SRSO17 transposase